MNQQLCDLLRHIAQSNGRITVLTGAGISAESGIPTFRGPEGYWTVGSTVYRPQEMATFAMFRRQPEEVWKWYLYRMGVCKQAKPNAGHQALVDMERHFGDRFSLITQNVDGLHLRAGNSPERTFQIHGNVFFMRCSQECSEDIYPIPDHVRAKGKDDHLSDSDRAHLRCPRCQALSRPHILLFDESYNEHHYHFYTALSLARRTALLLIVGTSGATNLPNQVAHEVHRQGGAMVDVNIEENPFSLLANQCERGFCVRAASASALPELAKTLIEA